MRKMLKILEKKSFLYRTKILEVSKKVTALHVGGAFSATEILNFIYNVLKKKGDTVILSKGHCAILQYVILNEQKIISDKFLFSYCQKNSKLGVHPDRGNPGIVASTGSLGHGLGLASGLAIDNQKYVYVVISDGELMEGSTWEYLLTISSLNLKNIILFIDFNGLQSATRNRDTHPTLEPISEKLKSFGWQSFICNGHNFSSIYKQFCKINKNYPAALICKTIKGFPIPFMRNVPHWHYRSPNNKEYEYSINYLKNFLTKRLKSYEK
jgi:transketolase